jgi:hypothetical protein
MQQPLAIAIISGLIFQLPLVLIVLPVILAMSGVRAPARASIYILTKGIISTDVAGSDGRMYDILRKLALLCGPVTCSKSNLHLRRRCPRLAGGAAVMPGEVRY